MRATTTVVLLALLSVTSGCAGLRNALYREFLGDSESARAARRAAFVAKHEAEDAKRRQAWVDAATRADRARWGEAVLAGKILVGMPWNAALASYGKFGYDSKHESRFGTTYWCNLHNWKTYKLEMVVCLNEKEVTNVIHR